MDAFRTGFFSHDIVVNFSGNKLDLDGNKTAKLRWLLSKNKDNLMLVEIKIRIFQIEICLI